MLFIYLFFLLFEFEKIQLTRINSRMKSLLNSHSSYALHGYFSSYQTLITAFFVFLDKVELLRDNKCTARSNDQNQHNFQLRKGAGR